MTVQELLFAILPRLQDTSGVEIFGAANAAVRSIGKRLAGRRSDLVKKPVEVEYAAGDAFAALPAALLGFAEDPYLLPGKIPLTPLQPEERADLDKPGRPRRYELIGRMLYLFPYPENSMTLKGMGYQLPAALTSLDEGLPWPGVLEELLQEAVYRVCSAGPMHVVDPAFEAFIEQEIDRLLPVRSGARPRRARSHHF
ncbi:MAG: phage adaptor protein [Desulfuromonadales bacterium]